MPKSQSEQRFYKAICSLGLEYKPDLLDKALPGVNCKRRFRYDFVWVEEKVTVEVQGGLYQKKSGHNTGNGITRDIDKVNLAAVNDWVIFQIPGHMNYNQMLSYARMVAGKLDQIRKNKGIKKRVKRSVRAKKPEILDPDVGVKLEKITGEIW